MGSPAPAPATAPGVAPAPAGGRRSRTALVAFVVLVVLQVVALYWPRIEVQGPVTWSDKVVHLMLFLLPVVAGLVAGLRPLYVVGAMAVHAPVSELVQHYLLPHRSGDVGDAVADLAGVVLGVTLVVVGRRLRR